METARLRLRRFTPADAPALAAYRSDPEVSRYQSWESPVPSAEAERLAATLSAGDPRDPGWFQYAVERLDVPGLIGDVGVCRSDDGRQAELGFTFAPEFQGRGYASEAVARTVEFLLVKEGLHRVSAACDGRNVRSARLLERVGFRREGHLVRSTWIKGEWTDDVLFGLLASEYPARTRTRTRARKDGHGPP
ncbi:GNAT family N-acetyltransferase [Streptomyces sp. GQFP]|uniref:GNAT family N-acetyltransferase n=1 Tax=Streptomyces sp. GQFP TaxID=2907545 RepID=UPI001F3ECB91|nr:GNAT family protein [Streptomyces sp. GQFP]UIX31752.1 GNAT family N-acetyltransferase [Streptomyces sp. GQFP]